MGFTNLFKAMAFRLAKRRMTWAFLAAFAALVVAGVVSLKALGSLAAMAAAVSETSSDVALGLSVLDSASGGVSLVAAWLLQVWASVSAYALIAVAVALVSGSSAVSAIAGLLLGGAAVENLLYSSLGLLTGRPDEVRQVFDGYLAVTVSQLGYGNVLPWDAMLPVLTTIVIVAAAGMMIMRRRRLA